MNTQTLNTTNQNVRQGISGCWIYSYLPDNLRIATKEDFFSGKMSVLGIDFLVKSLARENYYEAHVSRANTYEKWQTWIDQGHVYISKQ